VLVLGIGAKLDNRFELALVVVNTDIPGAVLPLKKRFTPYAGGSLAVGGNRKL
jgi:hypothetical protein